MCGGHAWATIVNKLCRVYKTVVGLPLNVDVESQFEFTIGFTTATCSMNRTVGNELKHRDLISFLLKIMKPVTRV